MPSMPTNAAICLREPKFDVRFAGFGVYNRMNSESPPPQLALLKPSEVAAQLGVSRSWLYDAAKTGRIPSIRIGGEGGPLRFVPEDLALWLDQARAAWTPGRPTVATRPATELLARRPAQRRGRQQTSASGQQSLL